MRTITPTALVMFLLVMFCMSNTKSFGQDQITMDDLGKFVVAIKPIKKVYDLDNQIRIRFEVTNITNEEIRFCKRNSPLEGKFVENYFVVTDESGKVMEYVGESFQRMAPTQLEYVALKDMTMIAAEIDLKAGYKIESTGKYKIYFKGDKLNNLPNSDAIEIEVQ